MLLISEDLDEILALADRIVVMYEGAIAGELDAPTATVEELGLLMAGGRARVIRIERRLRAAALAHVAVPVGSLVVAFGVMTLVLARHRPRARPHVPRACRRRVRRQTQSLNEHVHLGDAARSSPASAPRSRSA